jgi:hypothetical protein
VPTARGRLAAVPDGMGQLDGGFTYSPDVSPLSLTEGMFREKHRKTEILADPFIVMPAKVAPLYRQWDYADSLSPGRVPAN